MTAILPYIALETAQQPTFSIIWLHGLGADGEDFVPIADELQLPVAVRYIFPHAPSRPVTVNGGFVMRAWYDISGNDISAEQDAAGIGAAQADIEALIAQEVARGIAPHHIFLAGFSQGGGDRAAYGITPKQTFGRGAGTIGLFAAGRYRCCGRHARLTAHAPLHSAWSQRPHRALLVGGYIKRGIIGTGLSYRMARLSHATCCQSGRIA